MASSPVVVTLLTPSPAASRRVQRCLSRWFGFHGKDIVSIGDALDGIYRRNALGSRMEWDSVEVSSTGSTSTLFHLLSPKTVADRTGPLSLLAIQQADSVEECRSKLADSLPRQTAFRRMMFTLNQMLGKPVSSTHLLGRHGLPLLQWSSLDQGDDADASSSNKVALNAGQLKEVAIPAHDDASYGNEHNQQSAPTLFSKLSPLCRPVTGLYQFPATELCLRPLPTALQDRRVAPSSLIFHVNSLESELEHMQLKDTHFVHRIGYTGTQKGQIMLRHPDLHGLDLRLCESNKRNSMFAEAQESLMAGSLEELQSTHVLEKPTEVDPRTNNMDCWVEFRATVRHPSGFFQKKKAGVAKAPDIPYE